MIHLYLWQGDAANAARSEDSIAKDAYRFSLVGL